MANTYCSGLPAVEMTKRWKVRFLTEKKRKWTPTQIYFIEMATGKIIQATEGPNLGSAFLANKTNRMFVSRKEKKKLEHVCNGLE